MDLTKQIVDQRIRKIVADNQAWFDGLRDDFEKNSRAFLILSVSAYLGIEAEEAHNLITDGTNDKSVDAIYIGDLIDVEFPITIFQAKYKHDLELDSNFPENDIQKLIQSIWSLFDPKKEVTVNDDLKPKVNEIRSLISDGYIPSIKIICTNNGLKWSSSADKIISNSGFNKNQVTFEHFNHEDIINLLQSTKGVRASLHFTGKCVVEDFNYKRVLIGKLNVTELSGLFETYGDRLLEKNIRRYLGLNKNRINESIQMTLLDPVKKENFYFYNNGITIVSSKFSYNALQADDWNVTVEDLQIINGGQTCKTIQDTIRENPSFNYSQVFVLVRLYELSGQDIDNLVTDITIATNSQNPVDLRDLKANHILQKNLEISFKELGFVYKRKKDTVSQSDTIPSSVVAESVYAIWRKKPHQAKYRRSELFGKFYEEIFQDLNSAQAIIAVFIYRYCDNQRRKVTLYELHPHLPYSNYFLSMIIGQLLLSDLKLNIKQLTHTNYNTVFEYFEKSKDELFKRASDRLEDVLNSQSPEWKNTLDPRRLSAIFRRGDILDYL